MPGPAVVGDAEEVLLREVDAFFQEDPIDRFVPDPLFQELPRKAPDGTEVVDRLDAAPQGPLSGQGLDFDDSGEEVGGVISNRPLGGLGFDDSGEEAGGAISNRPLGGLDFDGSGEEVFGQ